MFQPLVQQLQPEVDDCILLELALAQLQAQSVISEFLQHSIHPVPVRVQVLSEHDDVIHVGQHMSPAISSQRMWFMNLWNVAGAFCSLNHMTAGSNSPRKVRKAHRCWCAGQISMDGKPPLASILEKIFTFRKASTQSRILG